MEERLIIAIDGPAGSGKSTVAREVAGRLNLLYIDTGAMYRALTLKAMREKVGLNDEAALVRLARKTNIKLEMKGGLTLSVLLDGEDVSEEIRTSSVTSNVKHVARIPNVRKQMVILQRKAASGGGAVLEGRDIGTVVFPHADKKVYLDAKIDERVGRRYRELTEKRHDVTLDEVREDVETRDHTDETREVGPLKKADDAIVIDTTGLAVAEVVERIIKEVEAAKKR